MEKSSPMRWLMRTLLLVGALALAACASTTPEQPRLADHQFSFNGWYDDDAWAQNIDLLAYSYGNQYRMARDAVQPPRERLGAQSLINGPMPVGEFLYVKWRIKATGEVRQDRVDLRPLLPKDMTGYGLTFVPDGRQLVVYLVTPATKREHDPPLLKTTKSRYRVTYEIYPHNTFPRSQP